MRQVVFIVCLFSQVLTYSQEDSLLQIIRDSSGVAKSTAWVNLSRHYVSNGNSEKGLEEGRKALQYALSINDTNRIAMSMFYLSRSSNTGDSSFFWIKKAIPYADYTPDYWPHHIHREYSFECSDRAFFEESIMSCNKNVEFAKEQNDSILLITSLHDLGFVSDRMKDYEEAIRVYNQALPIAIKINEAIYLGRTYGLIGIAYDELRDFEKAKEYNLRAISYFRSALNTNSRASSNLSTWLSNLGNTYTKTKEYSKAKECLEEALALRISNEAPRGIGIIYINLGKLSMSLGQLPEAKGYLDQGIHYAEKFRNIRFESEAHNRLSEYYTRIGSVDSAMFHLDRYHVLNDSLINVDKAQQISDLQVRYETEKQIQANQILESKNQILGLQKNRHKTLMIGSLCLLALVLVSGLFGYNSYKSKQEAKTQSKILEEREKGIKSMIQSVEEERQRIAKDLHDGVGQQMAALKLKWNSFTSQLKSGDKSNEAASISSIIDGTAKDIRSVSHQMMPRALMELGLTPALEDMLTTSFEHSDITFNFNVLGKESRLNKESEVGLFRIAQELVNNIIKHSKAKHVEAQLIFRAKTLVLTMEDDGVGMSDNKKDGVGLLNIMSRLNAISGEAHYEDAMDSGTVAVIKIPLDQ